MTLRTVLLLWPTRLMVLPARFMPDAPVFCLPYKRTCLASSLKQGNAGFKLAPAWFIKKHAACSPHSGTRRWRPKRGRLMIHQDSWTNQSCCYAYSSEKLHGDSRRVKTFHCNDEREGFEYGSRSYPEYGSNSHTLLLSFKEDTAYKGLQDHSCPCFYK